MEKEQNNKVVDKEINAHCVENIEVKWNTKSFSYSTTRFSTYLEPAGKLSKKTSHITSSGQSDHPSSSPSVAMSMNTIPLLSIKSTTLTSDVPSEKSIILVL